MKTGSVERVFSRVHTRTVRVWSHRFVRRGVFGVALVGCFVVGFQLMYPRNRTLPNASIDTLSVGFTTHDDLAPLLQSHFDDTKVTFKVANVSEARSLSELGATLDVDSAAKQLTAYPVWQRLLPFSFFLKHPKVTAIPTMLDNKQLGAATEQLAKKLHSDPKNGEVTVDDTGEVVVSAAKDGVAVKASTLQDSFKGASLRFGANTVTVQPTITPPAVTNEEVKSVKSKLTDILKSQLVIQNSLEPAKTSTPDKKTLASWIVIDDKLALSIDKEKLAIYADGIAKTSLLSAGTTTVVVIDGVEQSRVTGAPGRSVDVEGLTGAVTKSLLENGDKKVTMNFKATSPTIVYQRSYSSSQAGLQAYLDGVSNGNTIGVAVKQLGGAGWSASTNGSKSVVAASTYKLFVATMLFDKVNTGKIKWTDLVQGTDVTTCLRNMVVLSANNCAEQWVEEWGRPNINTFVYGKGFSSATSFMATDAAHTSANDLLKFLVGLHDKSLLGEADAARLTDYMKQQVYRKGIPAGSVGAVADKVGFLWDYLNDAALVYHPRGTYALVVMTKGQSWGKIAEITRQVEKILYP